MQKLIQFLLLFILAAACGAGAFYFLGGARADVVEDNLNGGKQRLPKTRQEFHDRVAQFRMARKTVKQSIEGLNSEKSKTLAHLKKKGVNSSADVNEDDPDIVFALGSLKRLVADIKAREKDLKVYDEAIVGLETQLDDLKRKYINDQGTITEDEYLDLQKHILDLNERLNGDKPDMFEAEELRNLLDEEIEAEKTKSDETK